jgi:hypothetical protein
VGVGGYSHRRARGPSQEGGPPSQSEAIIRLMQVGSNALQPPPQVTSGARQGRVKGVVPSVIQGHLGETLWTSGEPALPLEGRFCYCVARQ